MQAVRSNTIPKIKIPTDDKFKTFGKKVPKPTKAQVVADLEAPSRFATLREEDQ